ncbi:hypothetical protein B0H21DRAFT_709740 [Amylocystis lapponica]|nr:hypothetical protein B0H21DRAFT_709740 [Amylocystis lapponica]
MTKFSASTSAVRRDLSVSEVIADIHNCKAGIYLTGADIAAIVLGSVVGAAVVFVLTLLYVRHRQLQKKRRRESNASFLVGNRTVTPLPLPLDLPPPLSPMSSSHARPYVLEAGARSSIKAPARRLMKPTTLAPPCVAQGPSREVIKMTMIARKGNVPSKLAQYTHPRPMIPSIHYAYPCHTIEPSPITDSAPAMHSVPITRAPTPIPSLLRPVPLGPRPRPSTPHTAQTFRIQLPRGSSLPSTQESFPVAPASTALAIPQGERLADPRLRQWDVGTPSRSSSLASSSFSAGERAGRVMRGDSIDPHRLQCTATMPHPRQLGEVLKSPV